MIPLPNRLLLGLLQSTELLIFYYVTILFKPMQLQMLYLVGLQERLLELSRFRASPSGFYSFGPHPVSSLYFFDLVFIAPSLYFQNTCLISVMLMQRILKQVSWRIYKDNGCDMKLSCGTIKKRQSKPDNLDWASWIRRLERLW